MKTKLAILGAVIALGISGCGSSPKSVDDLMKSHTLKELDTMFKECKLELKGNVKNDVDLEKAFKKEQERKQIVSEIYAARGELRPTFPGFGTFGHITDEEVSKFGDKDFAEHVACGRIYLAAYYKKEQESKK